MSKARQLAELGNAYDDGALSNRNLIINGAMQVAQRGTSSTLSGRETVDRTFVTWGGGAVTQTQNVLTSGEPYDLGFRYSYRMQNTTATSATDSYRHFYQYIEGQNIAQSGWDYTNSNSYITFSFWAKSSVAGIYYSRLELPHNTPIKDWIKSFTLDANTWKKVTITVPGQSGLVINTDNTTGASVWVQPYYGTDYTGSLTTEQWFDFDPYLQLPDFAQNWANVTNATFEITGLQLEVGDTATPFEHRFYGQELALCQRYYQVVLDAPNPFELFYSGYTSGAYDLTLPLPLKSTMRSEPTMTTSGTTVLSNFTGYPNFASSVTDTNLYGAGIGAGRYYIYNSTAYKIMADSEL